MTVNPLKCHDTVKKFNMVSQLVLPPTYSKRSVIPVVKWVGGKRRLLSDIKTILPKKIGFYIEPFVGGGAMLCDLQPQKAAINDKNAELMNLYRVIKNDVDALIHDLYHHQNTDSYYYALRRLDRGHVSYEVLSDVQKASRTLYLNKTCFNGLYRVNRDGKFNAPYGWYRSPEIVNADALKAMSDYFNHADIQFCSEDFEVFINSLNTPENTFFYLDPPYFPLTATANFTGYTPDGFTFDAHVRLKRICDRLHAQGHRFLLSNSSRPEITHLFSDYKVSVVKAKRSVSAKGNMRDDVDEVLIRNY